ncbi:MAG: TIGR00268 family protein [Nitrospirae bacterium GWC2_42_7]|nr:MAG: TIGR00268 family protein [Nitrospirae bacterium GWC2_42_7]
MNCEAVVSSGRKYSGLLSLLQNSNSAILAFSGGVDSSFLLKAMKDSGIKFLAVTASSGTIPQKNILSAVSLAGELEVQHRVIETGELMIEAYTNNPSDRCFYCKDELFGKLKKIASENNFKEIFDGSNADDLKDHRPGRKAAALHGVRSPLSECGFTKDEIRKASKELGLDTWDKPSSPCLASRFPYGQKITEPALRQIEKAEDIIRDIGIKEVRVRYHADTARIEVAEEGMQILMKQENRLMIIESLKALGFKFVSLDMEGYKSGSLNRVL